jgi:hypothetical protein
MRVCLLIHSSVAERRRKEGGEGGTGRDGTYLGQVGGVGQVTVVEEEVHARGMPVLVQVLDAVGVEGGRTTDDLKGERRKVVSQ